MKGDKQSKELLKEYYSVTAYAFKGDKVALCYQPNYQFTYVALFENGKLKWKQQLKKSYIYQSGFQILDNDSDTCIMIEQNSGTMQVYLFEEDYQTDYCIKSIRNITFQYPLLAYAWGTRELWIQDMNNNVAVYYFDGSIVGMENEPNVSTKKESRITIGMILDNIDYLDIGNCSEINF